MEYFPRPDMSRSRTFPPPSISSRSRREQSWWRKVVEKFTEKGD